MAKIPVTVYTTPSCVQCNQTKKILDREGVHYTVVDLAERPDLVKKFKDEFGFTSAPIVTTDVKAWSGFKLNKILSLASYIRSLDR